MSHKVVSQEEWIEARKQLLKREKDFTKERDALSAARRELPWVKVDKDYTFEGANGKVKLADLFGDQSQLIVYHYMFSPDWDEPCKSCTFWVDNFDGLQVHLRHRDINNVAISHAPYEKLAAFRKRMGWSTDFFSSFGSDFNYDYNVSFDQPENDDEKVVYNFNETPFMEVELPGISCFIKDLDGTIYRTYSTYGRGLDMLNLAYHYMDIAPKGRDEGGLPSTMAWLRFKDRYEN